MFTVPARAAARTRGDVNAALAMHDRPDRRDRAVGLVLLAALVGVRMVAVPARGRGSRGFTRWAFGDWRLLSAAIRRASLSRIRWSGLLASAAGLFVTFVTYSGEASARAAGRTRSIRSPRLSWGRLALRGFGFSATAGFFGALMFLHDRRPPVVFNVEPLWQPLLGGSC